MKFKTFPSVWAIHPDELAKVEHAYSDYMKKEIVVEAKEALFDIKETGKARNVQIIDNVGILSIEGVIVAKSDIFTEIFGGAPLDVLTEDFKTLLNNDDIDTIVLNIDSPGGTVEGVATFADMVFRARSEKKILAHSSSIMTSAAIWIGAAAEQILISDNTVTTGSIGVLTTHLDYEGFYKQVGIIPTEITAGTQKRITSQLKPLTEDGRAVLQGQVDHLMEVFVGDVARFKGVTTQNVSTNMADGELFIGSRAVAVGLIDAIISLDDLLAGKEITESTGAVSKTTTVPDRHSKQRPQKEDVKMETMKDKKAALMNEDGTETDNPSALKKEYDASVDLQQEFPDFETYRSYAENHQGGNIRILDKSAITKTEAMPQTIKDMKAAWEASDDLRSEFRFNFGSYQAYCKNSKPGN